MPHKDAERLARSLGMPIEFMEGFMGDELSRQKDDDRKLSLRKMAMKHDDGDPNTPVKTKPKEAVHHPDHYGGKDNPYEAIKVIEAWKLGFNLGNTVKYIARAGQKFPSKELEDLEKAAWYLNRQIMILKGEV